MLHANSVGILWNLYAPSRTSNVVQARKSSLTAANVDIVAKERQEAWASRSSSGR